MEKLIKWVLSLIMWYFIFWFCGAGSDIMTWFWAVKVIYVMIALGTLSIPDTNE